MSRGQVAYFDQRADRAALASQTTPNSDIPFIKYKKVSRLRRNYPRNSPRNSPLESRLFYGFVVGACVAGAALIVFFDRSLQTQNDRSLRLSPSL